MPATAARSAIARAGRASNSSRRISATPPRMRAALARIPPRCGDAPGGRKPCGPLHRRRGRLHRDQYPGHLQHCWKRRAATMPGSTARPRRPSASSISRPTRSSARSARPAPFSETTPYDPRSPYSASKAASDHLVRAWRETYGLPVLVTNCSNNYGPYHFPEKLIPLIILNALEGSDLPVYGDGSNIRDWLLRRGPRPRPGRRGRARPAGRDLLHRRPRRNAATWRWWRPSATCWTSAGPAARPRRELIRFVTDRPGHDQRYAIDCGKIERELGWTPAGELRERHRRHHRLVPGERMVVAAAARGQLYRRTPRADPGEGVPGAKAG